MGRHSTFDESPTVLIPGLPDDISMLCLIRVPRKFHQNLRAVCSQWRSFISSQLFVTLRAKHGYSEGWVYVISRDSSECLQSHVLDPSHRQWMTLPPIPDACSRRFGMSCTVQGGQLFLIGGCGKYDEPTNEVHVFDAVQNKWKTISSMNAARCFLVSSTLDDKVYAIGGTGIMSNPLTSFEVYDSKEDKWQCYEDSNVIEDVGTSLVLDGKIYVRHISHMDWLSMYAAVFDPIKRTWDSLDDEMAKRWYGPAVLVGKDVYMLDETYGIKLMALNRDTRYWDPVGRISPQAIQVPCKMAVIGSTLFIVGKGLKTLALDIGTTLSGSGMLVTSSITGLQPCCDNMVQSCNTIYI